MTDTYEMCSCGSRQKSKCVKENGMYGGYHGFGGCLCLEDVVKSTAEYTDVIIEQRLGG